MSAHVLFSSFIRYRHTRVDRDGRGRLQCVLYIIYTFFVSTRRYCAPRRRVPTTVCVCVQAELVSLSRRGSSSLTSKYFQKAMHAAAPAPSSSSSSSFTAVVVTSRPAAHCTPSHDETRVFENAVRWCVCVCVYARQVFWTARRPERDTHTQDDHYKTE